MIIFDELRYAEDIIKNKKQVKNINYTDTMLLTKYFEYKNPKYGKKKLLKKLFDYYSQVVPNFSIDVYYKQLEKCVNGAYNYTIRENKEIHILKNEMTKINEIENDEIKRLLFIMLCLAKFYNNNQCLKPNVAESREKSRIEKAKKRSSLKNTKTDYSNKLFLKKITYQDLFKLAKITYSVEKKNRYIYYLNVNKYINTMSNQSTDILVYDGEGKEDEEGCLSFKCYDNLIYEFDFYFGLEDKLKRCEECNKLFKLKENDYSSLYCSMCKREKQLEHQRNSMKKIRDVKLPENESIP